MVGLLLSRFLPVALARKPGEKLKNNLPVSVPMSRGGYRDRRIRKVTTYVCATCYLTFTTGEQAKEHWAEEHGDGEW